MPSRVVGDCHWLNDEYSSTNEIKLISWISYETLIATLTINNTLTNKKSTNGGLKRYKHVGLWPLYMNNIYYNEMQKWKERRMERYYKLEGNGIWTLLFLNSQHLRYNLLKENE